MVEWKAKHCLAASLGVHSYRTETPPPRSGYHAISGLHGIGLHLGSQLTTASFKKYSWKAEMGMDNGCQWQKAWWRYVWLWYSKQSTDGRACPVRVTRGVHVKDEWRIYRDNTKTARKKACIWVMYMFFCLNCQCDDMHMAIFWY